MVMNELAGEVVFWVFVLWEVDAPFAESTLFDLKPTVKCR